MLCLRVYPITASFAALAMWNFRAVLARVRGYQVRIVYFDVSREVCEKRILQREDHPTLTPEKMRQAINGYESRLVLPTEDECDELVILREDQGAD